MEGGRGRGVSFRVWKEISFMKNTSSSELVEEKWWSQDSPEFRCIGHGHWIDSTKSEGLSRQVHDSINDRTRRGVGGQYSQL